MIKMKPLEKLFNLFMLVTLAFSMIGGPISVLAEENTSASEAVVSGASESVAQTENQSTSTESQAGASSEGALVAAVAASDTPTELNGVIVAGKSVLYDVSHSEEVTANADGEYEINRRSPYRYGLSFDLSSYSGTLRNGDYFNISISAPATLRNGQEIALIDPDTQVQLGTGLVTANGDNQGGSIRVTLSNLEEYLKRKGGTEVYNVKGSLWFDWRTTASEDKATLVAENAKSMSSEKWALSLKTPERSTYDSGYNFTKRHGAISNAPYTSAALGKSGTYVHPWTTDINFIKANHSQVTLHDEISTGNMQFIPESLVVKTGDPNDNLRLDNARTLDPSEYTITYNADYTAFDLTIPNAAGKAFVATYNTTSPADGSTVGNTVSMKGDGVELPYRPGSSRTSVTATNSSRVTEGGTIQADTFTVDPVSATFETSKNINGSKQLEAGQFSFELKDENGQVLQTKTNDASGKISFDAISYSREGQYNYTITEVQKDGKGWTSDKGTVDVTVNVTRENRQLVATTTYGDKKDFTNTYAADPAIVIFTATKKLEGRELTAGEFSFQISDETGKNLQTKTNDADGKITFDGLQFTEPGTYLYTISEIWEDIAGITFSDEKYLATVQVEDKDGQLVSTVTLQDSADQVVNQMEFVNIADRGRPLPPNVPDNNDPTNPTNPNNPTDPTNPNDPGRAQNPTNPTNPNNSNGSGNAEDPSNQNGGGQANQSTNQNAGRQSARNILPRTGTTISIVGMVVGFIIAFIGFFILKRNHKRH